MKFEPWETEFSDHFPLYFENIVKEGLFNAYDNKCSEMYHYYKWKQERKEDFLDKSTTDFTYFYDRLLFPLTDVDSY